MARTFRTVGSGSSQTLHQIEDEKIPVYATQADLEDDLANLEEGQIVATEDGGGDEQSLMEYVDGRLETTTTEISMSTFKTGSKAYLYKSGNNVQFSYAVDDSSTFNPIAENTWVKIGTIPAGYRPKSNIDGALGGPATSTDANSSYYRIQPNGDILVIIYSGAVWPYQFSIQCDYNVDGTNSHAMSVHTLQEAKDYTDEKIYEKIAGTIKVTDCDTMDVPGTYNYDPNTTNTPDNYYGVLTVYGSSPDKTPSTNRRWIMQVATNTRGEVYRRQRSQPQQGGTWSPWEEMDVLSYDIVVANPSSPINGYLSQIKYLLNNADWSKVNNAPQGRSEFVGSMELAGYWYGTYELSHTGLGYKVINGSIYGEGIPVRFSGWYDPNYGWRVSISYNYTYIDISAAPQISNLNEQLSTALNLLAPQTWEVQHCECNIEVLGYFYVMCTFDMRGAYASLYGTILSSNPDANGQSFTAEFDSTRGYWKCHNIILKATGSNVIDGNSNVYLGAITGTNDCEIIAVRCTSNDIPVIPAKNSSGYWYGRATNWDGTSAAGSTVTLEIQFRLL